MTLERYDVVAGLFNTAFGERRLLEVTTSSVEAFLKSLGAAKGPSSMRTGRNVLSGMFRYAVRKAALSVNPVRESQLTMNIEAKGRTGGTRDITIEKLRFMLAAVRTSRLPCPRKLSRAERNRGTPVKSYTAPTVADYCENTDLADWVTLLAATGLRRSQTLGGSESATPSASRRTSPPTVSAARSPRSSTTRVCRHESPPTF
ncbi:hypothetical protein IRT45_05725 [Nocardia sp. BSTN01]|uniref:hypothetical protein n=1 Tax=Nocardia sp. BSTN01 TaxID=2783665 RepID=UPI001890079E|nr:hypothetical protein [Nocardia sp. BSTN01]MBF4996653.1 hypothetical protein [Nocardia sp. BSTN01]